MSANKAKHSKRALPSVPFVRSGSADLTASLNLQKINAGSKTSKISTNAASSTPTTPEKIFVRKSSAPVGVLRHQLLKNSPLSIRRRLLQERRDSDNSNSSDSPLSSRRGSKESLTVIKDVGELCKEDGVYKTNDRKIARVLPMSPALLTDANESSSIFTSSNFKEQKEPEIPLKNLCKKDYYKTPECSKTQFGTPKSLDVKGVCSTPHTPYQMPNIADEDSCSIKVAVRVRPLLQREKNDPKVKICVSMNNNETSITSDKGVKYDFLYDHSLWSADPEHPDNVDQEKLYKLLGQPLLHSAFEGYNTCLFAYGQTGSGKSYSIMGQGKDTGVLPRFCEELFERISVWPECKFTVEISYFEIYNEKIHDLLVSNKGKDKETKKQLRVREHPIMGPFVQDLSTYVVSTYSDIESWLALGNRNRATAATGMNDKSSRSHSVFTIIMTQTKTEVFEDTEAQLTTTSKINLIDLAGSERASQVLSEQVSNSVETANLRLKEGGSINKSLHTLGKVISLLSDKELQKKKKMYIPYRDSILTWLLKDSLGGNSKTAMIANISPASSQFGETLSTLRYAQRARTIINKAVINEDPNAKIIRELRAEIDQLHKMHASNTPEDNKNALAEIQLLREKLMESQQLLVESTRNWQEKFALSERRKREEAENLKKAGISFKVDNRLPNLVNLNEDPQLSEMLLYILKPGISTVGHREKEDIQLSGALVAESHCVIKNEGEKVTVTPLADAPTYVNGQLISEEAELHHGDRLVIGGDHYFRLNHPIESKKRKEQHRPNDAVNQDGAFIKDFEFARNELAQVQNARLQAELEEAREEARLQAQEEIMKEIQKEKEEAAAELMRQKSEYETRNEELQQKLDVLNRKKEDAERSNQSKEDVISELQAHRQMLEQEILSNRKKLQMEALAAKQALEETKLNQIRIMSELEKEKKKMQDDVLKLKEAKKQREKMREEFRASFTALGRKSSTMDDPSKKELLRITMALREANKISQHMKKYITFSRDEVTIDGKTESKVRLNDTKKGLTTLWTIDKFESRLDLMRDLYQQDEDSYQSCDDDPFYDADDQWDKDFKLNTPNSRRISTMGALSLASRKTTAADQGDNKSRAESIFAKYRNRQESSTASAQGSLDISSSNLPSSTPEGSAFDSPTSSPPLLTRKVEQPMTSTRIQSRGSSCDVSHVRMISLLCAGVLGKSLTSLQEKSDGSKDQVHEKVLCSIQRIKASLINIKKIYQQIKNSSTSEEKVIQENCMSLTVAMEKFILLVQLWECSYHGDRHKRFTLLRDRLNELIQDLSSLLVKILLSLDESTNLPNLEEIFSESDSVLKEIVKQTAKLAILTMKESDKECVPGQDEDLQEAFTTGQEQFLQSSMRQSLDTLESIQEQIDENIIRLDVSEVEKEITEEVLKLLRATSDFIHQGREIQFQLQSATKDKSQERRSNGRFPFIVRLVRGLDTILDLTKALASTTPQSCNDMDLNSIFTYPEQIATATEIIARSSRAYIDSEYNGIGKGHSEEILDEQEYFEKKAKDVHLAGSELKNVLRRFMFLNPRGSQGEVKGPKTDLCGTPYSTKSAKGLSKDEGKISLRQRYCNESPI